MRLSLLYQAHADWGLCNCVFAYSHPDRVRQHLHPWVVGDLWPLNHQLLTNDGPSFTSRRRSPSPPLGAGVHRLVDELPPPFPPILDDCLLLVPRLLAIVQAWFQRMLTIVRPLSTDHSQSPVH